ncbi:nucleoside triphosphate pyrophosphohydrolase [Cyanobacterium stanieri LEGE 03274]|uniref:Nucleoside triphosphate pyrophosphohydrolase n=1 Tax=Cyanobacterium stanieri LEGE 03274 TaxID=1828756 RepID=A0ABR9V5L5_9CHRO|nr:nucleoside triphosphate pyrophosphohydrolase [Cyanobacterium stanieri]MBE9223180.1 nucleoside triphosphate pyrophosphohydrolase [Cyanobacterium stanieri LEGE 03274]
MNIFQTNQKILMALDNLIQVVAKLRSPQGGCPWDLEQTQTSLIPYIIEEAYEVVDAIESGNQEAIADELGDLLLQVVLQAQVAQDNGDFNLQQVAENITQKLIRRHPHVFGDVEISNSEQVHHNWEKIKEQENPSTPLLSQKLSKYHRSLPPLMASEKISKKAAKAGFEWENVEGVWEKFEEELGEFKEALDSQNLVHAQEELGDLLFTVVNLARWYKLDVSMALRGTNQRFIQRLQLMENYAEKPLSTYSIEELETLWQKAKKQLNG